MTSTPDTVTEATQQLQGRGFVHDADVRDGTVHVRVDGEWEPLSGDIEVEEIHRFEGTSNPADEMIVLGIHDPTADRRAVLVSAYGADTDPDTADCLRALIDDR